MSRRGSGSVGLAALAIVAASLAALGVSACVDKSSAATATADGGDSALVARSKDAGADGGQVQLADSGLSVDDLVMPQAPSEELTTRMRHLLEAISQNNPDLASDMAFPRDAFIATRDAADPQKAWEKKQAGAFRRAVERSHKRTKGIENAKYVGFELGHSLVQAPPKKHEWKRPLWKVKHSKLTFTIDGKVKHLEIAEMTAWRGAWYVTRLSR